MILRAEHIGSKTAVQVRSHAQKFFSKLEKQKAAGIKSEGAQTALCEMYLPSHEYLDRQH